MSLYGLCSFQKWKHKICFTSSGTDDWGIPTEGYNIFLQKIRTLWPVDSILLKYALSFLHLLFHLETVGIPLSLTIKDIQIGHIFGKSHISLSFHQIDFSTAISHTPMFNCLNQSHAISEVIQSRKSASR